MPEFLVHFKITIPPGTHPALVAGLYQKEALAAEPLIKSGHFRRVWREPGTRNHWALWAGPDANFIHECYSSFPLWQAGYAEAQVIPLAANANDPGWPGPGPTEIHVESGEPTDHLNDAPGNASLDDNICPGPCPGHDLYMPHTEPGQS